MYEGLGRVQRAMRTPPARPVDRALSAKLSVLASREAARRRRQVDFRARIHDTVEHFALFLNNLMRPLALPAAGGLASAVLLFLAVMPNFQGIMSGEQVNDVPTVLSTQALLKSTLFESVSAPDYIEVELLVDEQGRVIDYELPKGLTHIEREQMRRVIGNSLLFSHFDPPTIFGTPTLGWVRLKFCRTQMDVRG
jgi:hypothetical protein